MTVRSIHRAEDAKVDVGVERFVVVFIVGCKYLEWPFQPECEDCYCGIDRRGAERHAVRHRVHTHVHIGPDISIAQLLYCYISCTYSYIDWLIDWFLTFYTVFLHLYYVWTISDEMNAPFKRVVYLFVLFYFILFHWPGQTLWVPGMSLVFGSVALL